MKKTLLCLALMMSLLALFAFSAAAETFYGDENWRVAFTADERMDSNFRSADLDDAISGLQPGDNIIFTLALSNEHSNSTNWYMTNEVLYSLEDRSTNAATSGGAYTYILTYIAPDGAENVLFSSDTVGGDTITEAGEGLNAATDALEDFFYLDTLTTGQTGRIRLEVALDGETQGNDYQDTLADLQMNFAVELSSAPPPTTSTPPSPTPTPLIVKTGDETNLVPWLIVMGVSGAALLVLGILSVKKRRAERNVVPDLKLFHRSIALLLVLCAVAALLIPAMAAGDAYTYTVRIFAGEQGTINGSEYIIYEGLHYGDRVNFNLSTVALKNGSKYYVRGIRESGKDNNTVGLTSFSVTQDQDYVVAYGLLGNAVAYTIRYLDEDGNELAPSETYYGNVGDKPVVAYLYIDGYQPRYYNLTRTLGENAADNVFDFVYTRVVAAQEPETPTPAPSAAPSPGGTTQPQESAAPTEPGETTSPTEPGETTSPTEPGETTPPTEPGGEDVPASSPVPPAPSTDPGAVTSPDDTSNPDQTEPIEIGDLDVPLAEFDGEDSAEDTQLNEDALRGAEGPDRLRIFAVIFGIVLAVAVVVSAFWYFLTYRKKRKNKQ